MAVYPVNPNHLLDLDNVTQHIQQSTDWLAIKVRESHVETVANCIDCSEPYLESPLEAIFLTWFHAVRTASCLESNLELRQQYAIQVGGQSYRLDFAVTPGDVDLWFEAEKLGVRWPEIGVELDGHDYHERTKEQVIYRNKRDRELQQAGWTIFHFSGSELHNNPSKCAEEVFYHAWRAQVVFQIDIRNAKAKHRGA